jgi:hypothetical protein
MLRPIVRDMQGHVNEAASRLDGHHLFALEGILPGFFNASEATRWKPGRSVMVRDAAAERSAGLARVWDVKRQQAQEAILPDAPGQADDTADAEESGQGQNQEQSQEQEQDQVEQSQEQVPVQEQDKDVGMEQVQQSQEQDKDAGMEQSELPASVVGISTSTDAQTGPPAQNVLAA